MKEDIITAEDVLKALEIFSKPKTPQEIDTDIITKCVLSNRRKLGGNKIMEEKLNLIYEKLLDLEIAFKAEEYQKRLKELEAEKRDIQYRIDDLKYIKEKELEYKEEMLSIFKNAKIEDIEEV